MVKARTRGSSDSRERWEVHQVVGHARIRRWTACDASLHRDGCQRPRVGLRSGRLQVFDQDGNYLMQMTQFGTPASMVITSGGLVYVAAGAPENRVTIGTVDGKVLEPLTGSTAQTGLRSTRAVACIAQSAGKAVL